MQTRQLNVRVQGRLIKRIADEKKNTLATNDIVVEVALDNWFSSKTPTERDKFYRAHNRRPYAKAA